ncbi:hypothetical protein Syun_028436 [Stephania yunnanensis]|uniref:Pentatricopeptide repeat-containing protein n=1 Tax=Stephania yunnanensis TaxID=152371 RepID=A0AAP0HS36_9MAGN
MEKNGSTPNEITLSVMIQGFLHKNDVHNPLRLFNLMIERNFSPNAMTISKMMCLLAASASDSQEAAS